MFAFQVNDRWQSSFIKTQTISTFEIDIFTEYVVVLGQQQQQ